MSDDQLVAAISAGGYRRNKAIEVIYNWQEMKDKVRNYVIRHGGDSTDGLDIFHEGIIALDSNIRQGKFRQESGVKGYLYSICRFAWNNEWRRRMKSQSAGIQDFQLEPDPETPEIILQSKHETDLLRQVVDLLDESCRKIMTLWKLSFSMEEIASALELSSPAMAKKYRYRCMQKLMKELDRHPKLLEALKHV